MGVEYLSTGQLITSLPGSSTDNAIVRWDGTGAASFQNSGVTIDDSNNVIIAGNLTVSGTTSTINSTTTTYVDPIIHLQTASGGGALAGDSNKDVGIAMQYHTGSAAKTAFLGIDDSDYKLMFIPEVDSITSEVVAGTVGTIKANLEGNADTATALAGTLTTLQVDYINLNASTITITDSTDTGDLATLAVTTHGATTLTTVDDNATAAHLVLDVDGNIEFDSAAGIFIFEDGGTEVLRITESGTGDVTIKLETDGKDLIFTDNADAVNMTILDAAVGINVPGEVQTTGIAFTDGDNAMTIADGGGVTFPISIDITGSTGIILENDETITNSTNGEVAINGTVVVGTGGAAGTLKSSGNFDLTLATGNSTTGTITITDGANGDITLAPNGTGNSVLASATSTDIILDGNKSVTPGDGAVIHVDAHTITDSATAQDATTAKFTHVNIEAPTLAASNTGVTTSDAATFYISGTVAAGTNQTLTRPWAMWVDAGNARFDGSIYSGTTEAINSSGLVQVANQSAITGVSTITSGTWTATPITQAYIDDDIISGQVEMTSGFVAADELLYSDGGVVKKIGLDTLTTYLAGVNAGTVTSTGLSDASGVLTLDIQNLGASTTIIDADLVVVDDGADGTLKKMTRADLIGSASITMEADTVITLGEAGKIDFGDEEPADDAATGIVFSFLAGATLAIGDVVYMHTDGEVAKADANQVTTMPAIGICVGAGTDGNAVDVLVQGIMHDTSAFPTFSTVGADIFVSAAATGAVVDTAPSGSGDTVQKIGVALHEDMVYFNFNTTEVLLA